MYIETKTAYAWNGEDSNFTPVRPTPHQPRERVARRAVEGRLGRCVAVRSRGEQLEVLVAGNSSNPVSRWVPAELALSKRQAAAWVQTGF